MGSKKPAARPRLSAREKRIAWAGFEVGRICNSLGFFHFDFNNSKFEKELFKRVKAAIKGKKKV